MQCISVTDIAATDILEHVLVASGRDGAGAYSKSKNKNEMRGFFAALRMTSAGVAAVLWLVGHL